MTVNPANATEVAAALRQYVADKLHVSGIVYLEAPTPLGRGMDTRSYSFHLNADGLGPQWSAPLVLRLYTSEDQAGKAQKEADVQTFAVSQGYPAVEPLLRDRHAAEFDLPIMVMPRVDGKPLLDLAMSSPLKVGRWLQQMAELQVALHALPTANCPLERGASLVERKLLELRGVHTGDTDQARALEWLEQHKATVAMEEIVLCHGDFHPLNILIDESGKANVLDWSDAVLGDRHFDVARSVLMFWIAPIIAESTLERVALRAARGYLQWQYLRSYRRLYPIDDQRLGYWKALHALGAWQLVTRVQDPEGELAGVAREDAAARLPANLATQLQRLFWKLAAAI